MGRPKKTAQSPLTPDQRKFVDLFMDDPECAGNATKAMRKLGRKTQKVASVDGAKMMKRPAVVAAIEEKKRIKAKAEEARATAEAKELGKRQAVTKADVMDLLWKQATMPNYLTNSTMNAQVRASIALSEILGMKIGPRDPDKFDGFTESEIEQYCKDGTIPERFLHRFRFSGTPGTSS